MKKVQKILIAFLIFGAVTSYAFMSTVAFNFYLRAGDVIVDLDILSLATVNKYEMISPICLTILLCLFSGGIPFVFTQLIKSFSSKSVKKFYEQEMGEEERKSTLKKNKLISMVACGITYAIPNIILFVEMLKYNKQYNILPTLIQEVDLPERSKEIWDYAYNEIALDINPIVFLMVSIVLLILNIFYVRTIFREKNKEEKIFRKILRVTGTVVAVILCGIFVGYDIFHYVKIPEFQCNYEIGSRWNESNQRMEEMLVYTVESKDIRDIVHAKSYKIPSKIWGKEVGKVETLSIHVGLSPIREFSISSDLSWDVFRCSTNTINPYYNMYCMDGVVSEWFMENNIAYKSDKSELYLFNNSIMYIPASGEVLNDIDTFAMCDWKKLDVADGREDYFDFDNVLYQVNKYEEIKYSGDKLIIEEVISGEKSGCLAILPMSAKRVILTDKPMSKLSIGARWARDSKVIFPKDMPQPIGELIYSPSEIEVEDGNQFYAIYEGNLYNKELTKLIYVQSNKLKLPATFKEIAASFISDEVLDSIEVAAENPYYTSYNGDLYNKDMTKLIYMRTHSTDEQFVLPKTVKEISEEAFEILDDLFSSDKLEIDEENPYFTLYSGDLYNKDMTELIYMKTHSQDEKFVLPKTVEEISEDAFEIIDDLFGSDKLEIENGNENFVIIEDALYSKDRSKLYLIDSYKKSYQDPKKIILNLELNYISESALERIGYLLNGSDFDIIVEEENENFAIYNNNLYNADMTELIYIFESAENNAIELADTLTKIDDRATKTFYKPVTVKYKGKEYNFDEIYVSEEFGVKCITMYSI